MLFFYYLNELKFRVSYIFFSILFNFCVYFTFSKEILFLIIKPLLAINNNQNLNYFIFTNMSDVLFIYIKVSLIIALISSIPVIFFQFWFFLIGGLYNYEKNFLFFIFVIFLVLSFILFILFHNYIISFIWFFFINFELNNSNSLFGVYYEANIMDYVGFIFYIYFVLFSLLIFPLIMIFFIHFEILTLNFFIIYRKYFYTLFLILSGIFSPPDILSQIFIAIIFYIIYELILILNLVVTKYYNFYYK